MGASIKSSQNVEYEPGKRASDPMETLKTLWDALPISDLFRLQAFTRTAMEKIPETEMINLQLKMGLKLPRSEIRVLSDEGTVCYFSISDLSAGVRTINGGKVTPVMIQCSLEGHPTQQEDLVLSARQQMTNMKDIISSKLRLKIEGVLFADANDLAQAIADEIDSTKPELAKHIVVRRLIVDTECRAEADSTTSDQYGNAARGQDEELGYPLDESDDHDSVLRSTEPVEMSINGDDNTHQDLHIASSTAPGESQAAGLEGLMRELDAQLSRPSSSLPSQATPASPPTSLIDATIPTRRKMERGVVVALGSNVGNRIEEIEKACRAIDADPDMRIVDTSSLYETKPMYVEDQERFVNGACEVSNKITTVSAAMQRGFMTLTGSRSRLHSAR
jgi:hypothetical protein